MFPFYVFIFYIEIFENFYIAGTEKPFYEMNLPVTITDVVHVDLAGTVAPKFARLPPTRRHSQYATVISLWWLERRALCGSTKRVLYPKWTYVSSWGRIFWSYGFLHPSEFDQFDHGLVKLFIFFCLKLSWSVYKILTSSHVQRRDMVNNWSDFLLKCFPWTKLNTSNIVSLKKKTTPWVISPSSMKNGWRVTWLKKPRLLKSTNNQRYGVWHPFSYP